MWRGGVCTRLSAALGLMDAASLARPLAHLLLLHLAHIFQISALAKLVVCVLVDSTVVVSPTIDAGRNVPDLEYGVCNFVVNELHLGRGFRNFVPLGLFCKAEQKLV